MKKTMRFVLRPSDGLVIGLCFKGHGLKTGHVYEVEEVLGELMVREVGPSCVPKKGNPSWQSEIGVMVDLMEREFILTKEEFARLLKG